MTITYRNSIPVGAAGILKSSALTAAEIDANFASLQVSPLLLGTPTLPTNVIPVTASQYPTIQPSLNLDFANTRQLDPRITFVRNNTATYYDGQTTAMAEQNLLKYSQDFDNASWTRGVLTVSANTTVAPDGTTTADKLAESNTNTVEHYILQSSTVSAAQHTFSAYLKAAERTWASLYFSTSAITSTWFNLAADGSGGVGTVASGFTAAATYVGNGWYRCSITGTSTAASWTTIINPALGDGVSVIYEGTVGSGIYAWGAQLEQRSSATAYTKTTTSAITNYIPVLMTAPAGVARFDCDPITGKSLGLLIEESRVNSLDFSSSFATSGGVQNNWADTNITRTAAAFIAPDSTQVGIQFTASAANATVISTAAVGSSLARTFSVWLKRISGTGVINYTLDNGTTWIAQAITSTVTRYIFTTTTANQQVGFQIVTAGDSIGIWGAQLEAGSFATSLIPTVASTVTRAADQASMTGTNFSSWYNQAQGTMYVEWDYNNAAAKNLNVVPVGMGASGNNRWMMQQGAVPIGIQKGAVYVLNSPTFGSTQAVFLNGVTGGLYGANYADTTPMNNLLLGSAGSFSLPLTGHIRKLSYYPVALSSTNLVALTS